MLAPTYFLHSGEGDGVVISLFLSGAGREKARQLPRFFLFLPARSFLKEGPPRC